MSGEERRWRIEKILAVIAMIVGLFTFCCGGCATLFYWGADNFIATQQREVDQYREDKKAAASEKAQKPRPILVHSYVYSGVANVLVRNDGERDLTFVAGEFRTDLKGGPFTTSQKEPPTVQTFPLDASAMKLNSVWLLTSKPVIKPGELLELQVQLPSYISYPSALNLYHSQTESISVTLAGDVGPPPRKTVPFVAPAPDSTIVP